MPYIEIPEIHISPGEFIDMCSKKEVDTLYDILSFDYGYNKDTIDEEEIRSNSYREFLKYLSSLKNSWYSISNEEAEIIKNIAKKYDAV